MIYLLFINLLVVSATYGTLAGGRPNAFSEGLNALAGVVNPANTVWIADRIDLGDFWVHQKSSFDNRGNNPFFLSFGRGGISYRFKSKFAGRLEVLWVNSGNLPQSNNNVLPDASLNLHKRGSNRSPGPGLNDATYVNIGMGYRLTSMLSVGMSVSHRIKLPKRSSNFLSHTYRMQTIYDVLSFGANLTIISMTFS